jgi:polyferredoxin
VSKRDRQPTDSRAMRRRHERQVVVMVLLTLVVVGGGLIGIVFGWEALLGSLPFLLAGAGAIGGLYLFFVVLERLRG